MAILASLRSTSQLTLTCLSLVLFGVACGALVSDDLQGNPAVAILAFVSGLTTLALPGTMFLAYSKPNTYIATTWFALVVETFLFVFLTCGLAELTYNQMPKLAHCSAPLDDATSTPHNFGLVCTLLQTLMGVGWTCWAILTLLGITTVVLSIRRFWVRDDGVAKTPVSELWKRGWNGTWEKQSFNGDYA
ncbi:hypothetical protein JCM10212_002081 [Sporobolomyces blumeae]